MAESIRVSGLAELNRDFGRMSKQLQRGLQKELRRVGEPVAEAARAKASAHGFSAPTVSGLRIGTRKGGVVVRQRAKKTTGTRGDFGATQMTFSLLPALDENEEKVVHGVEEFLDRLTGEGFGGIL